MKFLLNESNDLCVEILNLKEYNAQYTRPEDGSQLFRAGTMIKHTKVHLMNDYIYGTFHLPKLRNSSSQSCYFYLDQSRLTIVEEKPWMQIILKEIIKKQDGDLIENPSQILAFILEWMAYSQENYLNYVENELNRQETRLLTSKSVNDPDFDHLLHRYGRELLAVKRYYLQLNDVCDLLEDYLRDNILKFERRKLQYITQHSKRLTEDAKDLREYVMQLREIYNADISNKQNRIMQTLTVVTTIFMPLTLLTGWYGMNFKYMPELNHPYGYFILMGFAALVIVTEIVLYKKMKWLE